MLKSDQSNLQHKLLGLLQTGFPLVREPYCSMGLKLGMSGEEVIRNIRSLKKDEIVRQISPVIDARSLGYQSTLVALKIAYDKVGAAEQYLRNHAGVSHGYERDYEFNIWITLSLPPRLGLVKELNKICARTGAEASFALPATRVFKLRTNFGPDDDEIAEDSAGSVAKLATKVKLSNINVKIINELQQDLPLVADPFSPFARRLNISIEDFLKHCLSLKKRGVIRRYGASINHYKAGYKANAMTCWKVSHNRVDKIGKQMALIRQVSHCYVRETNLHWPYNLFAMIHGHSKKACLDIVNKVSAENGLADCVVLFSTREFKKTRINYRID